MSVITIENLNFGYTAKQPILKNLNLEIPTGSIYGFLGANGAGKSTTIRNILGLLKPQSGKISVFGEAIHTANRNVFQRIGSLIESPSLYPQLSAVDNLRITCNYQNISTSKIDEILEIVKLTPHRKKAAGKYSTGMKQRLGLAMALMHDPELLILDEPTNGLDPKGISEMREIILQLKDQGKTIMLSSHLLFEIEKMVTHLGIIKNGEVVFEGSLAELNQLKTQNQILELKTGNPEKTKSILNAYTPIENTENSLQLNIAHQSDIPEIIRQLVAAQIDIYEVNVTKTDLEKMFISITNEEKV